MINPSATHDIIAVSANLRETAINTPQTLDTTMLWQIGSVINKDPRRQANTNEANGKEEADTIYDLGSTAGVTLTADMAQPQHFGLLYGYGLGSVISSAAGDGKEHVMTPIDGDLDARRSNPSFTAAQRFGKTVMKRLFASLFVDQVTTTLARDSWAKIAGVVKGTGYSATSITSETINAATNATSLTLGGTTAVQGATPAERLANVHQIKVELATGVWTEVAYSAVSGAGPAIITITAPGVPATLVNYKVIYAPAEGTWMVLPARVNETPLRVAQMTLTVGGTWTGSAFSGGRSFGAEMKQLELSLNNNGAIQFVPGAGDAYGSRYAREGRLQKVKLEREFRDYIMQRYLDDNATFGLYALLEGAVFTAGPPVHKYQVEIIHPKLGLLAAPITVDGKKLAEAGDLHVLEDDTYGSTIVKMKNLQTGYAGVAA